MTLRSRYGITWALTVLLLCGLSFVFSPGKALAYSSAQIDGCSSGDKVHCLDTGIDRAYGWDQTCRGYLNKYKDSTKWTLRDIINGAPGGGSASYAQMSWLSGRNHPNVESPTKVAYGATSVPLQVNAVTFLCGSLVSPDNGWSTTQNVPAKPNTATILGQAQRWVTKTNADDRPPNAIHGTNLYPARTETNSKVFGFTVSSSPADGNDGVSLAGGNTTLTVKRSETSRYWFANPVGVNYTDPNGITSTRTITVKMTYKAIAEYYDSQYFCASGNQGSIKVGSDTDWGKCGTNTDTFTMVLEVENSKPTGAITTKCNKDGTANAIATFKDADGSSKYPLTGTLSGGGFVDKETVKGTSGTAKLISVAVGPTGKMTFTLSVPDVGPFAKAGNNFTKTVSVNCAPSGTICPTFTTNPQTVTLTPENAPKDTVPSTGYGPKDNLQYRYVANNNYKMDSVQDQYAQNARGPTGGVGWSPTGESDNNNKFLIYYDGWIKDYPYDHHDITYYYETYYNRVHYTASGAAVYTCDGGNTTTSSSTCSSTYNPGCNAKDKDGNCTDPEACNSGDSGAYPTCTHTVSATLLGYTYQADGTVDKDNTHTKSNAHKAAQLPECYNRDFKVLDPADTDVTNINLTPTDEDPSTVTIGTQTTVQFALSHGGIGLRQPASVNGLGYAGTYTIKHADGTEDAFYAKPTDDQSFTVGTANPTPGNPANAPPYPYKPSYSISVPPLQVGDEICAVFTITPGSGEVDENGTQHNTSGSVDSTKKCSAPIVNQPYAQFFGNDVSAGGGINSFSSCTGTAGIDTANQGPSPAKQPYAGSGVQFGALSIGPINDFVSASLRTANPRMPTGLSFSNTSGSYGGSLGGQHCVPDYYATMPKTVSSGPVSGGISQAYSLLGNQNFGAMSVADGANVTVYVKGNVYIGGNITFANTSWPSLDKVPSFFLVVVPDSSGNGGNIYIGPNVNRLDGVYVAEGSGNAHGVIDTCADGFSSYPASDIYRNCGPWSGNGYKDTQLTVNGAFIANHVRLHRAFSSLRHGRPGETPNSGGTHACDVENGTSAAPQLDCAAEIFNFSPETYLGQPRMDQIGGSRLYKYDYLTSLSPVL